MQPLGLVQVGSMVLSVSTDLVLEEDLGHLAALPLGSAQSDLVIASREGDGRTSAADLTGAIVATHLPKATTRWFNEQRIKVTVVTMGGALEGVCSAGWANWPSYFSASLLPPFYRLRLVKI